MKILFCVSHMFYLRGMIPLIVEAVKKGAEVTFKKNRPDFLPYHPRKFGHRPTANRMLNKSSLAYVASLIEYQSEISDILKTIRSSYFPDPSKFDAVVGSTKDLDLLAAMKGRTKVYVVGHQHIPVLMSLNGKLKNKNRLEPCESLFNQSNAYSHQHNFSSVLQHPAVMDFDFVSFPYLDKIHRFFKGESENFSLTHAEEKAKIKKPFILVYHPGGYRNVISEAGDSQQVCYRKQKEFLEKVSSPAIDAGLYAVVKVHPMYANHHGPSDLEKIKENEKIIITDDSAWPFVKHADAVVSLGSSAAYEHFLLGQKKMLVLNYFGKERSSKFSLMGNLQLNSYEDYAKAIQNFDWGSRYSDPILSKIYNGYSVLGCEDSTGRMIDEIFESS